VLPFTNGGGDANTDYLSDGITESLIDSLAHVPQLKVKSRNTDYPARALVIRVISAAESRRRPETLLFRMRSCPLMPGNKQRKKLQFRTQTSVKT
jgi:hypothetical protein